MLIVYTEDNRKIQIAARGGDNYLANTNLQINKNRLPNPKKTNHFNNHIHPQLLPGYPGGIPFRVNPDLFTLYLQPLVVCFYIRIKYSIYRIVF